MSSVGIIGGADGPTAIFMSSRISNIALIIIAVVAVVIIGLVVAALSGRKKDE